MTHSQEKMKLTEMASEKAHTLDLLDENFKSTVLNMLKELKETMDKNQRKKGERCMNKWRISKRDKLHTHKKRNSRGIMVEMKKKKDIK